MRIVRSPWKWACDAARDPALWRRGMWVTTETWRFWGHHNRFPNWNSGVSWRALKYWCAHLPEGKLQPWNFSSNQNSDLLKKRHDKKLSASPVKSNNSSSAFDSRGSVEVLPWEKSRVPVFDCRSRNIQIAFSVETSSDIFPATVTEWLCICIMLELLSGSI